MGVAFFLKEPDFLKFWLEFFVYKSTFNKLAEYLNF